MAEWKSGQVILGEYTIEKELGRGGMGRVWLVKSNSTGRRFAVKQTLLTEDKHRKAFLAELQTWIDLPEHPNIVPCRFFRTVGDDVLIFSEFVDGGSLKNWIDSRRLYEGDQRQSLKRILDTAIQFAWGLHSIHELGLVHQDVKPGNVLMSSGAEAALQGMRVQVSDYGLARARARSGAQGVQAAGEGSILLSSGGYTPAYCSPEQAKGLPITRKTDLWSWGVSLLEMFTGGVTWHSGHLAGAVLDQYVEDADESSGIPVMPSALADILRKCFQHDPAKRWANMGEVVARLKTAYSTITGEDYDRELIQIVHRDTPQAGLAERRSAHGGEWADPRMWLEKALRLSGRNPAEASEIAERQGRSRRGQLVADLALFEEAKSMFLDMIKKGRRDLEPEIASLCMSKALVHCTADDIPGALAEYDQAIAVRRRLVEETGRRELADALASALMSKGHTLNGIGDFSRAIELYDQCIAIWQRLVEQERQWDAAPDLAAALLNKGSSLLGMGHLTQAIALYDQCIGIWRKLVDDGRQEFAPNLAKVLLNKAATLHATGNYEEVVECSCAEGIAIWQDLVENCGRWDLASDLATAQSIKADMLHRKGDFEKASALYWQCVSIRRQLFEKDGRREFADKLSAALRDRAATLLRMGNLAGALESYDECITIWRQLVDQDGRVERAADLASALMSKGATIHSAGDLEGAIVLYDECIAIRRRLVEQAAPRGVSLVDLSEAELVRVGCLLDLQQGRLLQSDCARAQEAYAVILRESRRTGRADLKRAVEWAQDNLTSILPRTEEEG